VAAAVDTDDWFAHYVPHCVSDLEWIMDKLQCRLAFTLRVDRYVSVAEDSAAN